MKLIEQKIGGPDWVGYHPHNCGYYGEVTLKKEIFTEPLTIYGIDIKIIEHRIIVLSIDETTRIHPHHYKYCEKEDERIMWSFNHYSPEENFVFNITDFIIE